MARIRFPKLGWTAFAVLLGGICLFDAVAVAKQISYRRDQPEEEAEAELPPPKGLEEKVDRVLLNQEKIFERLDEVMKELGIVKIRATISR